MIDLKGQYIEIRDEVLSMINEVLESSQYVLGSKGAQFEAEVGRFLGMREAVGVASGTDALHLVLRALGIGHGDEVITSPFSFIATAEAIIYTGARPVFADIDPLTFNIDPTLIERAVTKKTKALLPVHIFGHPADMAEIMDIGTRYGLPVIEDCAQSFGAALDGRKAGSFGAASCFSFYPSKNLGAYGDGGLVAVNSPDVADEIRRLRNHGSRGGYRHDCIGYNSRLDELQAAVLLVKLSRIEQYNNKRRSRAALYTRLLRDVVACPVEKERAYHVFHQYTIRSPRRDEIRNVLKNGGISSVVYYPVPLHLQEALGFLGYKEGDFPVAEAISKEALSLPMYPELTDEDIGKVAHAVRECLGA